MKYYYVEYQSENDKSKTGSGSLAFGTDCGEFSLFSFKACLDRIKKGNDPFIAFKWFEISEKQYQEYIELSKEPTNECL